MRKLKIGLAVVVSACAAIVFAVVVTDMPLASPRALAPVMAVVMFVLLAAISLAVMPDGPLVIRTRNADLKCAEDMKKRSGQEAQRTFALIVVNTAREYPAILTESLRGKLASLQEAHPNDVGNIFCDMIAYLCVDSSDFANSLDKATTELEEAQTAKVQLESRNVGLNDRCVALATTNRDLNDKLGRVDTSLRFLLSRACDVMQALVSLKLESATGEQVREIRMDLGAIVLYWSMRAGYRPHLADTQILVMGEAATYLLHQFDLERAGHGKGLFDPRQIETSETRPIEAITAMVARYGVLRQAKRSAASQQ